MKECVWVKPESVCQVEYVNWTEANHLRHRSFTGLVWKISVRPPNLVQHSACAPAPGLSLQSDSDMTCRGLRDSGSQLEAEQSIGSAPEQSSLSPLSDYFRHRRSHMTLSNCDSQRYSEDIRTTLANMTETERREKKTHRTRRAPTP